MAQLQLTDGKIIGYLAKGTLSLAFFALQSCTLFTNSNPNFSQRIKEVSFNVYQRASEKPVLRILKNLKPKYFNEKYLIKDKNGSIVKKSENLNQLISKTSWNKLKLIK